MVTKKKTTPAKKGRPKIEIDWKQFDKLCAFQCTLAEISSWFECSEDTIERRCKEQKDMLFAEYFKKKSATGKISLRRLQFESAKDGNTSMQIWLGKQYLSQRDQPIDLDSDTPQPIKVEIIAEDARVTKDKG